MATIENYSIAANFYNEGEGAYDVVKTTTYSDDTLATKLSKIYVRTYDTGEVKTVDTTYNTDGTTATEHKTYHRADGTLHRSDDNDENTGYRFKTKYELDGTTVERTREFTESDVLGIYGTVVVKDKDGNITLDGAVYESIGVDKDGSSKTIYTAIVNDTGEAWVHEADVNYFGQSRDTHNHQWYFENETDSIGKIYITEKEDANGNDISITYSNHFGFSETISAPNVTIENYSIAANFYNEGEGAYDVVKTTTYSDDTLATKLSKIYVRTYDTGEVKTVDTTYNTDGTTATEHKTYHRADGTLHRSDDNDENTGYRFKTKYELDGTTVERTREFTESDVLGIYGTVVVKDKDGNITLDGAVYESIGVDKDGSSKTIYTAIVNDTGEAWVHEADVNYFGQSRDTHNHQWYFENETDSIGKIYITEKEDANGNDISITYSNHFGFSETISAPNVTIENYSIAANFYNEGEGAYDVVKTTTYSDDTLATKLSKIYVRTYDTGEVKTVDTTYNTDGTTATEHKTYHRADGTLHRSDDNDENTGYRFKTKYELDGTTVERTREFTESDVLGIYGTVVVKDKDGNITLDGAVYESIGVDKGGSSKTIYTAIVNDTGEAWVHEADVNYFGQSRDTHNHQWYFENETDSIGKIYITEKEDANGNDISITYSNHFGFSETIAESPTQTDSWVDDAGVQHTEMEITTDIGFSLNETTTLGFDLVYTINTTTNTATITGTFVTSDGTTFDNVSASSAFDVTLYGGFADLSGTAITATGGSATLVGNSTNDGYIFTYADSNNVVHKLTVTDDAVMVSNELTLTGTTSDDILQDTTGIDNISTLEGADVVYALAGNDIITLTADAVWGAGYSARNVSNDSSTGTGEKITLNGLNRFTDVIDGGTDIDTLNLTAGNDSFFIDDVYSDHHSSLTLSSTTQGISSTARISNLEVINAGDGNDIVDLTSSNFIIANAVEINGGAGNDTLWGSSGNDTINGGTGDDSIFGGTGSDTLTGGTGADAFQFTTTSMMDGSGVSLMLDFYANLDTPLSNNQTIDYANETITEVATDDNGVTWTQVFEFEIQSNTGSAIETDTITNTDGFSSKIIATAKDYNGSMADLLNQNTVFDGGNFTGVVSGDFGDFNFVVSSDKDIFGNDVITDFDVSEDKIQLYYRAEDNHTNADLNLAGGVLTWDVDTTNNDVVIDLSATINSSDLNDLDTLITFVEIV